MKLFGIYTAVVLLALGIFYGTYDAASYEGQPVTGNNGNLYTP